jgi:hypothetical protein
LEGFANRVRQVVGLSQPLRGRSGVSEELLAEFTEALLPDLQE